MNCEICGKNYADNSPAIIAIDGPTDDKLDVILCLSCVSDEDDATLAYLRHASLDQSYPDEEMYGCGYMMRLGRFEYRKDDYGTEEYFEYPTSAQACKEWDRMYADGCGADEYDAYIYADRGGYGVTFEGKHIGIYERETRARAKVSLLMREHGYFPNVWYQGERGDLRLIEVW